jgi:hypothetical protein
MKKYICTVLFLLTAVSAFSQRFQFSTWARGVFVPYWLEVSEEDDNEVKTGMGRWTKYPRIGLDITGNVSGRVGIELGLDYDSGDPAGVTAHEANMWAMPFPWIKLTLGKFEELNLVGKLDDTELGFMYSEAHYGKDALFTGFYGLDGRGVLLSLMPRGFFEGLYIGALVNTSFNFDGRPVDKAKDTYKAIQAAAGYDIRDFGQARVQYIGPQPNPWRGDGFGSARFEAAFAYTGRPGLVIDAGVKIPLPDKEEEGGVELVYQDPYQAGIGVIFNPFGGYWIWGRFDAQFGWSQTWEALNRKIYEKFSWSAYLVNSYVFDFAEIGGEASIESRPARSIKNTRSNLIDTVFIQGGYRIGFGPWIRFNCGSGGYVKVATVFKMPTEVNDIKQNFVFAVPVLMQLNF